MPLIALPNGDIFFQSDGFEEVAGTPPESDSLSRVIEVDATTWAFPVVGLQVVRMLNSGSISKWVTTAEKIGSMTRLPDGSIYYCCAYGRLHRVSGDTVDDELHWPNSPLRCQGRSLLFNGARKSLIFPVEQNGFSAIAEYFLP